MPCPLLIFSRSDYLIHVVDTNSNTEWQTVQIQISWLLKKPTDLDLHCLQRQGISGFSRTRVKLKFHANYYWHEISSPVLSENTNKISLICHPLISWWGYYGLTNYYLSGDLLDMRTATAKISLCRCTVWSGLSMSTNAEKYSKEQQTSRSD